MVSNKNAALAISIIDISAMNEKVYDAI